MIPIDPPSLALWAALWAASWAAPACPADGVHVGASRAALQAAAIAATASEDPACRQRGAALADRLDRSGWGSCEAARRWVAAVEERPDPALAAEAALQLWRCGRPREAHRLAVGALRLDRTLIPAWLVLGELFDARFRERVARSCFREVLALDPDQPDALLGVAETSLDRAERRAMLEQYLAIAAARGEPWQRVRGARDTLEFVISLGDTPIWIVEREDLPGTIRFSLHAERPGKISGWIATIALGEERSVPALLDSGASGLHLASTVERRSGFRELSDATLVGGGGDREHAVRRGLVPQIDFGPIAFRDGLGTLAPNSLHPQGTYRAIVGIDLLGGTAITHRRGESRLTIEVAPRGEPTPADDDPLQADPWPSDPDRLPILRVEGQLLIPVALDGPRGSIDAWMVFDTGASRTVLDAAAAEQVATLRLGGSGEARAYGGALELSGRALGSTVRIGSFEQALPDQPMIDLGERTRLAGVITSGFLGLDVIGSFTFTLELSTGTLSIEPESRGHAR